MTGIINDNFISKRTYELLLVFTITQEYFTNANNKHQFFFKFSQCFLLILAIQIFFPISKARNSRLTYNYIFEVIFPGLVKQKR